MEYSVLHEKYNQCTEVWFTMQHIVIVVVKEILYSTSHIAKFMGPTWGPPGSCRSQMSPILLYESAHQFVEI